jgi:hypothetical protein
LYVDTDCESSAGGVNARNGDDKSGSPVGYTPLRDFHAILLNYFAPRLRFPVREPRQKLIVPSAFAVFSSVSLHHLISGGHAFSTSVHAGAAGIQCRWNSVLLEEC